MRRTIYRKLATLTLTAALAAAAVPPAAGMFMRAPEAPVERLVENLNAYLDKQPDDAQAHFLLARVHYIAFAKRSETILSRGVGSADELPDVVDPKIQWILEEHQTLEEDALVAHARAAIAQFLQAIALDEDNALYRLGLAGILEQSADYADLIGPLDDLAPAENEDDAEDPKATPRPTQDGDAPDADEADDRPLYDTYIDRAIDENLRAYELHREAALAEGHLLHPFLPIAYEAGKAYLRLMAEYRTDAPDADLVAQIHADITAIDSKPQAITPIVFRVEGDTPTHLDELLDPSLVVDFDLDADGTAERRPWVRPDTAILVWDPERTGRITSGRQLFGNMTFYMLFEDGYQALDALDNNRDGRLAGDELDGLALWHDRNSNGVSDVGEVTPIEDTAVRSIATTPTGREGIHPRNETGLVLSDGESRPTWDWIAPEVMPEAP
jgi:hypothetical protein